MRPSLSSVVCLAWFVACGGSETAPSGALSPGVWGGTGIQLTVTATGATIEFGCGSGSIDEQLVVDRSGRISAQGTYTFGRGGPIDPGDPPLMAHPAQYTGTIEGTTLRLTVFLPDVSRKVGDFVLVRGRQSSLDRCL